MKQHAEQIEKFNHDKYGVRHAIDIANFVESRDSSIDAFALHAAHAIANQEFNEFANQIHNMIFTFFRICEIDELTTNQSHVEMCKQAIVIARLLRRTIDELQCDIREESIASFDDLNSFIDDAYDDDDEHAIFMRDAMLQLRGK